MNNLSLFKANNILMRNHTAPVIPGGDIDMGAHISTFAQRFHATFITG